MSASFGDVSKNRKRKKDKSGNFNEFRSITTLVKKYKKTNKNDDLIEILQALEGIINTFSLILCPGNVNQQIYITPYMKRLLGMFLSKEEQSRSDNDLYNQALARVRWIMRHYTYEDIYSHILYLLIRVIKNLRIVGDCDCFYYIQWVMKFKIHKFIIDQTKDVTVNIADISSNPNDVLNEDVLDDVLDRLSFDPEKLRHEDFILDKFSNFDSIDILTRQDDIFKCFSYWEKYLIYLYDYVFTDPLIDPIKNISYLLKCDYLEVEEEISDIKFKKNSIIKGE